MDGGAGEDREDGVENDNIDNNSTQVHEEDDACSEVETEGALASSEGYSADYSESISSGSSSSSDRRENRDTMGHTISTNKNDGGDTTDIKGTQKKLDVVSSARDDPHIVQRKDDVNNKRRHSASNIEQTHRHRHKHHQYNKEQTQDVNRQMDDIMNLYNVSLHACRAAQEQHVNNSSQVPNNDKSNQVEATQIGPPVIDQLWQSFQEAYTNASTTFGKRASDILDQGNELPQDNNQDQYTNLVQQVHSLMSPQPSIYLPPVAAAAATQPPQPANDSSQQSSSGFTSFFTTTDDTSRDKKVDTACKDDTKEEDNHSDTSSLVVLARVKRKHLSSNSDGSKKSSSGDNKAVEEGTASTKRVRIDTVSVARNQGSQASSSLTQSLDSSTDAAVATKTAPLSMTTKRLVTTTDATTATTATSKSESSPMNVDNSKIKPTEENQHVAIDHAKTADKRQSISSNIDTTSKEELIEKKRRHRMNMRREYENERRDSSSSSDPQNSSTLLPAGKPITLEEVLFFTKTARLLVQALPPFLAVHSNAAFTNLCGIESSAVIGVGVSSIISLPNDISKSTNKEGDSSSNSDNVNKDAMSSLSGGTVSDPVVANDAVIQRDDVEVPTEDANVHPLTIDRLIVARGYGHVHDVNVACAVPNFKDVFNEEQNKKKIPIIRCRMSVCPVLSSGPDANPNNHKRRKTDGNSVKHYLIQLESVESTRTLMSGSSFASADTAEQARRCQEKTTSRAEQQESQGSSASVNSSVLDAIATCG